MEKFTWKLSKKFDDIWSQNFLSHKASASAELAFLFGPWQKIDVQCICRFCILSSFFLKESDLKTTQKGSLNIYCFFWRNIAFVVVDHRRRGDVEETEHLMFYPRRRTRFSWEFSTCSNIVLKILKSRSWLLWLVPTCLLRPISLSNLGG